MGLRGRREVTEDLVFKNKTMLARANQFYQDQKTAGIVDKIDRVNEIKHSREVIAQERVKALQKCWVEKNHMELQFERVRDSSNPRHLYRLAAEMGWTWRCFPAR